MQMYDAKVKMLIILTALVLAVSPVGCSRDEARQIRYDMEKLAFQSRKLAEKINIQPNLATSADSTALLSAYQDVIKYFFDHRNTPAVAADPKVAVEMAHIAVGAQIQLAGFYASQSNADSVIAAYRRIGTDIPAAKDESARAALALALTYRSLQIFDSTIAIYDRLLVSYYPPLDSLNRVNPDVAAIPIDRLKIAQGLKEKARAEQFARQAIDYYTRLENSFRADEGLVRMAQVNASRIYTMTEQWDKAIGQLERVKDSTGNIDISSSMLIANIYAGPLKQIDRAIDLYRQILQRPTDSSIIGGTMLRLGTALLERKDYEEGRKVLSDLKKKFTAHAQLVAPAQYKYALSFESEGRWDRALSELQWLMENYPYSEEAFRAASYIPRHFTQEKDQKLADIWNERAENFYLEAARVKQGQAIEAAAYSFLAELYRGLKRWDKALETLEKIHTLVPGTPLGAKALYNAAAVAYQELDDTVKAQNYLDLIKRDFGTTDSSLILDENKADTNPKSIE